VIREGRDRRGADQPDDPAVPRQLALDLIIATSIPLAVLGAIARCRRSARRSTS
jgi:hypothetical protein